MKINDFNRKFLKKKIKLLGIVVPLVLVFTACGSSGVTTEWVPDREPVNVEKPVALQEQETQVTEVEDTSLTGFNASDISTYVNTLATTDIAIDSQNVLLQNNVLYIEVDTLRKTLNINAQLDVETKKVLIDENTCFFDDNGILCVHVNMSVSESTLSVEKTYYLEDKTIYKITKDYDMTQGIIVNSDKAFVPFVTILKFLEFDYKIDTAQNIVSVSGGKLTTNEVTTETYMPITLKTTVGHYWSTSGVFTETAVGLGAEIANDFVCTAVDDYIPVSEGEEYRFNFYGSWYSDVATILFKDSNDQVLSVFWYNEGTNLVNERITVPAGASKMYLSFYINQAYRVDKIVNITGPDYGKLTNETYEAQAMAILKANQEKQLATASVQTVYDKAYISFVLDDCRPEMNRVADIFAAKGFPLCIAAAYENLLNPTSDGAKTRTEVCDGVVAQGGEILSHDPYPITADTVTDYTNMIKHFVVDSWNLQAHGYKVNGAILAGGEGMITNDNTLDMWVRTYFNYSDLYGLEEYGEPYYHQRYWLKSNVINYKSVIEDAIQNKKWVSFYFHSLEEVTAEQLTEILDYIATLDTNQIAVANYDTVYTKNFTYSGITADLYESNLSEVATYVNENIITTIETP